MRYRIGYRRIFLVGKRRRLVYADGMETTDSSLIRGVRRYPLDPGKWSEFVRLYEPLLKKYVRRQGVPPEDVDDVVQLILIRLLQNLPSFEINREHARFRTWLWRITRSVIVDWWRAKQRQAVAESQYVQQKLRDATNDDELEPDTEWIHAYRLRVLEYVLQRVQADIKVEKTWACFEQHVLRGRPSAEVGKELGLSANAVDVNAHRVLKRVRAQCAEYEEELGEQ